MVPAMPVNDGQEPRLFAGEVAVSQVDLTAPGSAAVAAVKR